MSEKLIILVTGAATGFGALTARTLAKSGHQVYAGILPADDGTNAFYEETREFARVNKVHIVPVQLDVTDDASIRAAVDTIISEKGSIDGLIHNAGELQSSAREMVLPINVNDRTSSVRSNRKLSARTVHQTSRSQFGRSAKSQSDCSAAHASQRSRSPHFCLFSQCIRLQCPFCRGIFCKQSCSGLSGPGLSA
jgi:NAD(P)-dependent dehydrogenase (short-subunit alcohol dehydrogenase family)